MVSLESGDSGSGVCKTETEKHHQQPVLKAQRPEERAGRVPDQNLPQRLRKENPIFRWRG